MLRDRSVTHWVVPEMRLSAPVRSPISGPIGRIELALDRLCPNDHLNGNEETMTQNETGRAKSFVGRSLAIRSPHNHGPGMRRALIDFTWSGDSAVSHNP